MERRTFFECLSSDADNATMASALGGWIAHAEDSEVSPRRANCLLLQYSISKIWAESGLSLRTRDIVAQKLEVDIQVPSMEKLSLRRNLRLRGSEPS